MRYRFRQSNSATPPLRRWLCAIAALTLASVASAVDSQTLTPADTSKIHLIRPKPIRLVTGNVEPAGHIQYARPANNELLIRRSAYLVFPEQILVEKHLANTLVPPPLGRNPGVVQHALNVLSTTKLQAGSIRTVEHCDAFVRGGHSSPEVALRPAPVRRSTFNPKFNDNGNSRALTIQISDQSFDHQSKSSRIRQVQGTLQPPVTQDALVREEAEHFLRQEPALVPNQVTRDSIDFDDPTAAENLNEVAAENFDEVVVPVQITPVANDITVNRTDGLVTLIATGADLPGVLRLIADHHQLNLVLGPDIAGPVTVSIRGARLDEVLDAILGVAGFAWHQVGNMLYVTGSESANMNPRVQGRTVQVYPLNYVAAQEVEAVANRLLSPVGNAFISESALDDQRRTREILVVEDTRDAHARIAQYIAQIDIAPKQVLVEAHVLQVALDSSDRHGINLRSLARLDGSRISLEGSGFADENLTGPSLALRFEGTDMDGLIELIQENTNSRTLASPKLSVVNHQEARIQIGQRLPYSVATTTQTSTIQTVEFLDVGIVLTVQPIITDDGNVLMTVLPKVSGGRITESGFPEEDTTELSTTILMPDGGGIVIGGLIREETGDIEAKVPGLSRMPVVGSLFKRRSNEHRRNELVIALVTHVLPDIYSVRSQEMCELEQTLPPYAKQDLRHPGMQTHSPRQSVMHAGPAPRAEALTRQSTSSNARTQPASLRSSQTRAYQTGSSQTRIRTRR
ncbi:type II secretion system protein GspD [Stieleria marina]|uniref:Type IV pilus biogenesis and competence protein PilQ n=1 Tax=Stieleria marina TaxID=1930275 RepID=A0A517NS92_9BACT|nr:Type IV pilus biogenesis and competence protein PilQ precursor [Planctomycetes bacterium K23_9]